MKSFLGAVSFLTLVATAQAQDTLKIGPLTGPLGPLTGTVTDMTDGSSATLTFPAQTITLPAQTITTAGGVGPVNGVCGSANGVAVSSIPTTNLCSAGTATTVAGGGPWTWNCNGSGGGSNAACSAPLASGGGLSPPPSGVTAFQTKVFDDNFASYNASNWVEYMTDGWQGRWDDNGGLPSPSSATGCGATSNGNCFDAEYLNPSQDAFGSGGLVLTETRSSTFSNLGYTYKSGVLTTAKAVCPSNGCFIQLSAKLPDMTTGGWPAFWMPPSSGNAGAEIDWLEGGFIQGSIPANNSWSINNNSGTQIVFDAGVDLTAAFHTYGFEYKPGVSLKIFLDNVLKQTITSNVPTETDYVFVMSSELGNSHSCPWRTCISGSTPNGLQLQVAEVQVYH